MFAGFEVTDRVIGSVQGEVDFDQREAEAISVRVGADISTKKEVYV